MIYSRATFKQTKFTASQVQVAKTPLATFESSVSGLYIPEILAYIQATQSGSGDPSPSNPRAINGVSSVNVCDTPMPVSQLWTIDSSFNGTVNFNQLVSRMRLSGEENGLTFICDDDGFLTIAGTVTTAFEYNRVKITGNNIGFIRDGRKYLVLLSKPISFACGVNGYPAECSAGSLGYIFTNSNGGVWTNTVSASITLNSTVDIKDLKISVIDLTQMFGSTIADYIYSLENATAGAGVALFKSIYPDDYYEYNAGTNEMVGSREGQTATTALGGTYYGGYVNVTTGLLTVTLKGFSYNTAQYYGTYGSDNANLYYVEIPNYLTDKIKNMQNAGMYGTLDSNLFVKITTSVTANMGNNEIRTQAGTPQYFYFRADSFADLTALNAFLANTPLQVVAELQTPTTYQLTPAQIEQLLGQNNVFCSTGDVAVKYYTIN